MAELRKWSGLPVKDEGTVTYCRKCGSPVRNTGVAIAAHETRVHSARGFGVVQ